MTTPTTTPIERAIADSAAGPAKASGDVGSVEQHPLSEQIAADRYLASKQAMRAKTKGLQIAKLVPPGAA